MERMVFFMADDDEDDIFFFREALVEVNKHAELITALNGVEAMRKLSTSSTVPDFIFLDLNMPMKGGKECLVEIRNQIHLQKIPVIIYTTSSLVTDRTEVLSLGANDFITKFIDFSDLCSTISDLINRRYSYTTPPL